jgi:hypothetical protein
MLVGIDLFARRCIEGGQLIKAASPVTYPPQLTKTQPPQTAQVLVPAAGRVPGSERVFRNEFPYLGRLGPAAWAGFCPVGGDRIVRRVPDFPS